MAKLVLGTVQLGMAYGVANTTGQPDQRIATEIVSAAWEGGIREFDTAQEYGESERVLGAAFRELGIADKVQVVSKLRKDADIIDSKAVARAVQESLTRLGVPKLLGLLVHREDLLDKAKSWVAQGLALVDQIGFSVYSPERALQAIGMEGMDIVQIPSNILDRRFERAGVFERAKERNVEVYVRSVFLQGLLLMGPQIVPTHMEFVRPVLAQVDTLARGMGITRHMLALQYIKNAFPDAHIVVGAETVEQVRGNVAAWNAPAPVGIVECGRQEFYNVDEQVLDPRKWPKASV